MTSEEEDYNSVLEAVEKGDESAKTKAAWLILAGLGDDEIDVIALLKERMVEGDFEAMWMLGVCKEFGIETKQNTNQAAMLYDQSRDGGSKIGLILVDNIWKEKERGKGYLEIKRLRIKKNNSF